MVPSSALGGKEALWAPLADSFPGGSSLEVWELWQVHGLAQSMVGTLLRNQGTGT